MKHMDKMLGLKNKKRKEKEADELSLWTLFFPSSIVYNGKMEALECFRTLLSQQNFQSYMKNVNCYVSIQTN